MTTNPPDTTQPTQPEGMPHLFEGLAAFVQSATEQLKQSEHPQQASATAPAQPAQD